MLFAPAALAPKSHGQSPWRSSSARKIGHLCRSQTAVGSAENLTIGTHEYRVTQALDPMPARLLDDQDFRFWIGGLQALDDDVVAARSCPQAGVERERLDRGAPSAESGPVHVNLAP